MQLYQSVMVYGYEMLKDQEGCGAGIAAVGTKNPKVQKHPLICFSED